MLAEAEPSLSPPGLSSAVANPLPLAAQLSRLEDAHRGGVSAASLEGGAAGLPGSGVAPPPLLPPRTRGALYEAAMSSVAASDALDAGYAGDDGTPQGRTACTASCLAPCAKLNGNVATLYRCGSRDARAWPWLCQWGPDWPCNIGTFMFILGPTIPFQALVAWRISIWVSLAGVVVALAALTTLCLTALSDPGYLVKQSKAQLEAQRRSMEEQGLTGTFTVCQFCNTLRAPRTSHCYDCNACVLELDHHCPWMGKCVGKYNLTYFYSFLWAITVLFLYTAASFFAFLINKPNFGG